MNNTYARLVIYRNVLGNKNIYNHELFGIMLELIYSNTIFRNIKRHNQI